MSRKTLYNLHSIFGLIGGFFLVVIGLSGSLLVFGHELDQVFRPEHFRIEKGEKRMSFESLREILRKEMPEHTLAGWLIFDESDRPDQIWIHPSGELSQREFVLVLDPYRGEAKTRLLEDRSDSYYGWMLNLHYTLFMGNFGYVLVGIFGIIFVFQGISGFVLYRNIWANLFRIRTKESLRTFFADFHKWVGIFSLVFNLILGFTGAWWVVSTMIDYINRGEEPKQELGNFLGRNISVDELVSEAIRVQPSFKLGYISFPHHKDGDPTVLYGTEESGAAFRSRFGSYFTFDSYSGKLLRVFEVSKENAFHRFLDSFRPLHFGTFGGLISKILWVILGLAPGILSITGVAILVSKKRMQSERKRNRVPTAASTPE